VSARRSRRNKEKRSGLDPYFAFLIFVTFGLGTWRVEAEIRLTVLWVILLVLVLIYAETNPIRFNYSLIESGRGVVIGLIISLPFLFLARGVLSVTAVPLFPMPSLAARFRALVLLAAPVEELFFRGILQQERGIFHAALLYGLGGAVFFLPAAGLGGPLALIVIAAVMALLGFVYGYVYNRYGLSASMACHAVVNVVLLFVPALLDQLI
jgi:membrane protease YdiL (CAAX protease family)